MLLSSKIKPSTANSQQNFSRPYQSDDQKTDAHSSSSIEMGQNQALRQDNPSYFQSNNNEVNYGSISNPDSQEFEPALNNRYNLLFTNHQVARASNPTIITRCKILSVFVVIGLASVLVMGLNKSNDTVKMTAAIILIADFLCAGAYMSHTSRF
jgi:hypothetical protein